MDRLKFKTTADIKVSDKIVDQIIGQEHGIEIIKKAAKQRRNVLLIGEPGCGKSMIGQALAQLLSKEKLQDVLSLDNPQDENIPLIRVVPKGQGKDFVLKSKLQSMSSFKNQNLLMFVFILFVSLFPYYLWKTGAITDIIYAASMITGVVFILGFVLIMNLNRKAKNQTRVPKLLIDNSNTKTSPFIDATGSHAGALLGDVLHDPLQCYSSVTNIIKNNNLKKGLLQLEEESISLNVNNLLEKHKSELINQKDYKATYLDKNELSVLGDKDNKISLVNVLSINKHPNKHKKLIKLITESGKELLVTPEHKIVVNNKGKKKYIEARKLKKNQEVFVLE